MSKIWFASTPDKRKKFNCSRLVGVEWEYNQCTIDPKPLKAWQEKWHASDVHDGSCGREIVTAPMAGDYIETAFSELSVAWKKSGTVSNETCGIHVHVDGSDIDWADMYRVLWTYSHVEPVLYLLAGQNRIGGQYSRHIGNDFREALLAPISNRKREILNAAYGTAKNSNQGIDHRKAYPGKKDSGRYRGLNITPWLFGRGLKGPNFIEKNIEISPNVFVPKKIRNKRPDTTLEFRLHRDVDASKDFMRVVNWTQVCAQLVDWAVKATDREVASLPKSALRSLYEIIAPHNKQYFHDRINSWRKGTGKSDDGSRVIPRVISFKDGKVILNQGKV